MVGTETPEVDGGEETVGLEAKLGGAPSTTAALSELGGDSAMGLIVEIVTDEDAVKRVDDENLNMASAGGKVASRFYGGVLDSTCTDRNVVRRVGDGILSKAGVQGKVRSDPAVGSSVKEGPEGGLRGGPVVVL